MAASYLGSILKCVALGVSNGETAVIRCHHLAQPPAATNVEYIPYHICSSKTVLHKIYHDPAHPSHLLLPVIPNA